MIEELYNNQFDDDCENFLSRIAESIFTQFETAHPPYKKLEVGQMPFGFQINWSCVFAQPKRITAYCKKLNRQLFFLHLSGIQKSWKVLPATPHVLCHGDLTMDNASWHINQVVSLLDFEFTVLAPVQLDLNHLVKCVYSPNRASKSEIYSNPHEVQSLYQAINKIALPFLAQPNERILLMWYAILLELWLLVTWLEHPEGEGPLQEWDPLIKLHSISDGKGGYLAPLLSQEN